MAKLPSGFFEASAERLEALGSHGLQSEPKSAYLLLLLQHPCAPSAVKND